MNASDQTSSWLLLFRPARRQLRYGGGRRPRGFTITELLVVIGIIILLAGILLVALGRVRTTAMRTTTLGTMQAFSQACDAFHTEHQQYPGVIPESVLALAIATDQITVSGGLDNESPEPSFTSTENALLHLLGGYRVISPSDGEGSAAEQRYDEFVTAASDAGAPLYEFTFFPGEPGEWKLAVNLRQIGEGPVINRQQYSPYFTPGPNVIGNTAGQRVFGSDIDEEAPSPARLPDLLDAWGQPVLYFRQVRTSGPLTALATDTSVRPQFYLEGAWAYLAAPRLGDIGETQVFTESRTEVSGPRGSILSFDGNIEDEERLSNFAQILRHPSFGRWGNNINPLEGTNIREVRARGAYAVFSAGPDGIYFSAVDGPGTRQQPVTNLIDPAHNNPQSIEEYNDVRVFGGG